MLESIVKKFFPYHHVSLIQAFGNGHINDTYKVDLRGESQSYILQKINTQVFTQPEILAENHIKLQEHICHKGHSFCIPQLIPAMNGQSLVSDCNVQVWRMSSFIPGSFTIEVVTEKWQAIEAGKGFGWFAKACHSLNTSDFGEPIRDFHCLSHRINQLNSAISENRSGRLESVEEHLEFFKKRESQLLEIEDLFSRGLIPQRVVHNDTKINNLLFNDRKAIAVIDLDTVGPGLIFYDYGDALRTCANTSSEDEKDLNKVLFNIMTFRAFTQGYFSQVKTILTDTEEQYMYLAPKLMTYIMGIRFLADYLNGDIYYKTAYSHHNLDRSKVQKKLIESMEIQENEMREIIHSCLSAIPENL